MGTHTFLRRITDQRLRPAYRGLRSWPSRPGSWRRIYHRPPLRACRGDSHSPAPSALFCSILTLVGLPRISRARSCRIRRDLLGLANCFRSRTLPGNFWSHPLALGSQGTGQYASGASPLCAFPSLGFGLRFGCLPLTDLGNFPVGVGNVSGWSPRLRALNLYPASSAPKGNLQAQARNPRSCHDASSHDGGSDRCGSRHAASSSAHPRVEREYGFTCRYYRDAFMGERRFHSVAV